MSAQPTAQSRAAEALLARARDGRAVVMGVGRFGGGLGAARFLLRLGADVLATDLRSAGELPEATRALEGSGVRWALGGHRPEDFSGADLVVANPAVKPTHPLLQAARSAGARITTELELFLAAAPCRRVLITGTQGKSSTTRFCAQLLSAAGQRVHLGGNLGGSLLDDLDRIGPDDVAAIEISSYQLEHLGQPPASARPAQAVALTSLLDDHLDRHGGREGYAAAKRRLLELVNPDGPAFLPEHLARDPVWRSAAPAALVSFPPEGPARRDWPELEAWPAAPFQRANAALALELARALGAGRAALAAAIPSLSAPPHRLEPLGPVRGIAVFDNGVSTTPDSCASALTALPGPLVWLAGGQDKGLDWSPAADAARGRLRAAVCFGAAAAQLSLELRRRGLLALVAPELPAATELALALAEPGDQLLFSPGCASFDRFPNFQERARVFRGALASLDPSAAPRLEPRGPAEA
jgi:UDP-N-acetylmuramoylalanine--D-glutamate ligase